jgi:flagellar biosynthesis GTPase FlhF
MSLTIESVKTAIKIGTCVHYTGKANRLWCMNWDSDHMNKVKSDAGRIYLIVSREEGGEGVIKKIGKSECKGGMKNTFGFYEGGLGGSPSIRTFGIHHLISTEIKEEKTIEIWGIWSKPVKVQVPGLFDVTEMMVTPSIHCMEDACRNDYKKIMGEYPPWNFQERGAPWPEDVQIAYKEQVANRATDAERQAKKEEREKQKTAKAAEKQAKKEEREKLKAEKAAAKLAKAAEKQANHHINDAQLAAGVQASLNENGGRPCVEKKREKN